jgi:hypothetical protein
MTTSRMMASGALRRAIIRACIASIAVTTLKPEPCRPAASVRVVTGSSAATRMVCGAMETATISGARRLPAMNPRRG